MVSESPGSVAFSRRQVAVEVVLSLGFACLHKKLPHFLCVDTFSICIIYRVLFLYMFRINCKCRRVRYVRVLMK